MVDIEADDVRGFMPSLLSSFHIEAMVHGNVSEKEALQFVDVFQNTLKAEPKHWNDDLISRPRLLPASTSLD